jgi:hypothetical protein
VGTTGTNNSNNLIYRSDVLLLPEIRLRMKSTRNTKNKIFAILAAPAAIPPKPNTAAMIATTRKITVQRNITFNLKVNNINPIVHKTCQGAL